MEYIIEDSTLTSAATVSKSTTIKTIAEENIVHVFYKRAQRKDVIYHITYAYNTFYAWNYHLIKAEEAKGVVKIIQIVNPLEEYDINKINPFNLKVFNM